MRRTIGQLMAMMATAALGACGDDASGTDAGGDSSIADTASDDATSGIDSTPADATGETTTDAADTGDVPTAPDGDAAQPTDATVDGADTSGPPSLTLAEFCDQAAAAHWHEYTLCFGAAIYPPDEPQVAVEAARCKSLAPEVDDHRLAFDGEQAARCIAAAAAHACIGGFEVLQLPACKTVFTGLVADLGACHPQAAQATLVGVSECADGQCYDDKLSCPATCHTYPATGGECGPYTAGAAACAPDAACDGSSHCAPRPGVGDSCAGAPCMPGLGCIDSGDGGVCREIATDAEACSTDLPCFPPAFQCVRGACRFRVDAGDPCLMNINCPDGLVCRSASAQTGQPTTCMAPAAVGAPCSGASCADGLYCKVGDSGPGTCTELGGAGDACTSSGLCAAGFWCAFGIDGGSCTAAGDAGDDCTDHGQPSVDERVCKAGLLCMADGKCHPQGGLGDTCDPLRAGTCEDGLWCAQGSFVCKAPAALGVACNPLDGDSCANGLGCLCTSDDATCVEVGRGAEPAFACGARTVDGQRCWIDAECDSGTCGRCDESGCVATTQPGRCAPSLFECVDPGDDTGPRSGPLLEPLRLEAAGWSLARCASGDCSGHLALEAVTVDYELADQSGTSTFAAHGILTTDGAAQLDELMLALHGLNLQVTYGCPGCTDGPTATLTLGVGATTFTTSYARGGPPPVLGPLDAFVTAVEDAMATCQTGMEVVIQGQCPAEPR